MQILLNKTANDLPHKQSRIKTTSKLGENSWRIMHSSAWSWVHLSHTPLRKNPPTRDWIHDSRNPKSQLDSFLSRSRSIIAHTWITNKKYRAINKELGKGSEIANRRSLERAGKNWCHSAGNKSQESNDNFYGCYCASRIWIFPVTDISARDVEKMLFVAKVWKRLIVSRNCWRAESEVFFIFIYKALLGWAMGIDFRCKYSIFMNSGTLYF